MPQHARLLDVTWIAAILLLGGLAAGCEERPKFDSGAPCEVTSECTAPLVCRLDRCRVECRQDRDCAAGLICLLDENDLGACQLPEEKECDRASDCVPGLVCRFEQCTNSCNTDRDCPGGATCAIDTGSSPDGGEAVRGCRDDTEFDCLLNSDCPQPWLVCGLDHRCRAPCRTSWDCRDGLSCLPDVGDHLLCVTPPPVDAGVDAGTDAGMDAGMDAGVANPGRVAPFPATLVGGSQHTCFYDATLGLRCWGSDLKNQLAGSSTSVPVSIAAVEAVGAGADHTCARTAADLFCWGDNAAGQLGIGSTGGTVATPTVVQDGSMMSVTARAITGGTSHTCVIDAADVVWCWGDNTYGQLAVDPGTTASSDVPLPVAGLAGTPSQVVARGEHTCALLGDGTAQCWGRNQSGQLGNGTTSAGATFTPQTVMGLSNAAELVAGTLHTCARRGDGSVVCWGDNGFGQIGDGTTIGPVTSPGTAASLPMPALELAAGSGHTCVVIDATNEVVYCWGDNVQGQCGVDPAVFGNDTLESPVQVTGGLTGIDELSAGEYHSCARAGASVWCWGQNTLGQLNGTPGASSFAPISVSLP